MDYFATMDIPVFSRKYLGDTPTSFLKNLLK